MEAREYTTDELRDMLIKHLLGCAKYWHHVEGKTELEKLQMMVFSFLTALDGVDCQMPCGFLLVPDCCRSDPEFLKNEGKNWVKYVRDFIATDYVIGRGDMLHDHLFPILRGEK